jgi:OOP family OmpA-OmpF porin
MKISSRLTLTAGIAALLCLTCAEASEPVGSKYFTPMLWAEWPDDARVVNDDYAFSIAFGKAVSEAFNVELNASRGKFDGAANNDLTLSAVGLDVLRVLYRDSRNSPFLLFGGGWAETKSEFDGSDSEPYADLGIGILATLSRTQDKSGSLSIRAELRGRHTFGENDGRLVDYMAGIGLQYAFGGRAESAPPPPVVVPPPPAEAELDSDGDGVPDSKDKCPGTPAGTPVDASGCEADTDGDGVLDSKDKCPNTPRGDKVDANGCSLTFRLEVLFETNSDRLTPASMAYLDQVATRLNDLPNVTGVIEGHTDNVGSDANNKGLSERRAKTVRDYLVSKGVAGSRLQSEGLGESKPIADNATEAGRAQNRRVVLRRTDTPQ